MSTSHSTQFASAVNTPLLLPAPDPVSAVVRYADQRDITYTIALEEIRAYSVTHPATTDWKRSVLAAAERLADAERADEQAARDTFRHVYGGNAGRYCRQCKRWNGCGHVAPKGR